ncbi:recombination protein O N-terminal domain-containing protein [Moraxella sp. FZLJ2107]|uniref:DNA repair protein RecO n=1 Tax=unclassified Moraxella TaxID=2685852 RepID=UPI0020C89895|nr:MULTISPECIES: recombination protein O N-terminal domain-containing protein [unclassified Moraxella]UTO04520.1 recombination protein O N-terminal domain-containing protein [Moraxella sp. FZLJ2107]UTO23353.1 recombination protein O N-terminal domain-containing protein [Moraxella sp. FZLJ2109]
MRATALNGYVLHSRAYQEKRAIYQFFSHEHGVVHGVGTRGLPLFSPVWLLATGNHALKSFSQPSLGFASEFVDAMALPAVPTGFGVIKGRVRYALLYMNEVLTRLLAAENPCPMLWQTYHHKLAKLQSLDLLNLPQSDEFVATCVYLRAFERVIFAELGVALDFVTDGTGALITADGVYRFVPQMGFLPDRAELINDAKLTTKVSRHRYSGDELMQMGAALDVDDEQAAVLPFLEQFNQLQRQLMDSLLDYKPLHSRTLWQQSLRYG